MAQFVWEGKKRNGKIVEGVMEAKDIQSVYNLLKSCLLYTSDAADVLRV